MPVNGDEKRNAKISEDEESEGSEGLELPKILTYDEIDLFLLAIDDLEDLIAIRLMLFIFAERLKGWRQPMQQK